MAPRHAFTFQLADRDVLGMASPGHAATVISTPQQQTYSGLGPAYHDWRHLWGMYSPPSFEPLAVPREETSPRSSDPYNYSTVSAHDPYATYTVPITEEQAKRALAEIQRTRDSNDRYNAFIRNYCTTDVNRNAEAAGLGSALPYEAPGANRDYLANVERTARANPRAKYVMGEAGRLIVDSTGRPIPFPEALREIQRDYAYVGGGYDTPSERLGHVSSSSGPPNPHLWRSGNSPVEFLEPDERRQSSTAKDVRMLSRRTGYELRAPEVARPGDDDPSVALDERFSNWRSSPAGSSPRNPNLPPPAESGRPRGLVSGEPMPLWVTPPPIWGDPENPVAPGAPNLQGKTIEDWLSSLLRPRGAR